MSIRAIIKKQVEDKVNENFFPIFFQRMKISHGRLDWQTCSCNYCSLKKTVTKKIMGSGYQNREHVKKALIPKLREELLK